MTFRTEVLEYLNNRKRRGSLNQSRPTVIELLNNTSVPDQYKAHSLLKEFYKEKINDISKETTPKTIETKPQKEIGSDSKNEVPPTKKIEGTISTDDGGNSPRKDVG